MKLRREMVQRIAGRVAAALRNERLVEGVAEPVLTQHIAHAISEDLMVEDRLNDEVRELLRQHADVIDRANVEYHEMFKTLKAKLVRERKLIL
jgi:hypothetical protein